MKINENRPALTLSGAMGGSMITRSCGRIAMMVLALLVAISPAPAQTRREVVVVTSFPSAFYEPFRRAFEAREPGLRLQIHNRKTTAAVSLIASGQFDHADVFWASAPDAFDILQRAGRFMPGLDIKRGQHLTSIGGFPINDPKGEYFGFSVSGYGLIWNADVLRQAQVEPPRAIADLANPRFRGLLAMSAPSRSGTTHLMVETILQRLGWERGWALWMRIAGNLATITARSYSVSAGVAQGRFGVGLSIDFLGKEGYAGGRIAQGYPSESVFLPASIAILKSARNAEGAKRFLEFVLSDDGQKILQEPDIGRPPVSRTVKVEADRNLFELAAQRADTFVFDAQLSARRYEFVNILFDEFITDRLSRLLVFWSKYAELAERIKENREFEPEYVAIAELAEKLPPQIHDMMDRDVMTSLKRLPRGVPPSAVQSKLVEEIRTRLDEHFTMVQQRLDVVSGKLERKINPSTGGRRE